MSTDTVQFIIGRAVTDPEYRELLFTDPEEALKDFELTEEEAHALNDLKREKFEAELGELENRISRAGLGAEFFQKTSIPKPTGHAVRVPTVTLLFC